MAVGFGGEVCGGGTALETGELGSEVVILFLGDGNPDVEDGATLFPGDDGTEDEVEDVMATAVAGGDAAEGVELMPRAGEDGTDAVVLVTAGGGGGCAGAAAAAGGGGVGVGAAGCGGVGARAAGC